MMDDLFNNVNVFYKGTKVSIAQHWDTPSDRFNGDAAIQEVAIVPENGSTWDTAYIQRYGNTLDDLIHALKGIRDEIETKKYNESSG
jgi:Mn-containing catalase